MKKLSYVLVVALMLVAFAPVSKAATVEESADKIYEVGKKYGMADSDKVQLDRFLRENEVTEAQAEKLLEKVNEAATIMEAEGVTKYDDLSTAKKEELKDIANEAATELDVSLVFKTKTVEIYKNGENILTISSNNGTLAYTGSNMGTVIGVVSLTALIALAVVFKKTVRAN